jgi:macrolide-specific efflux system membrane fusion protein
LHPVRRRRWGAWLLLVVAVGGVVAYNLVKGRAVRAKQAAVAAVVPTAVVQEGTLERTLRLTGQTSARNYASITVTRFRGQPGMGQSGLVLTQLAPGGSMVKTGDVIAQLDDEQIRTVLDNMQANILQAQLSLSTMKASQQLDWLTLEQTVRSRKAAYDQALLDYKAGEVKTSIEQELLKLSLDEAEAAYAQQQKALPFKKTSLEANLRISELALKRQELVYQRTLNDQRSYTFRAPMDGLVVLQTLERSGGTQAQYSVGDTVNPGRSFMKIVDTSSMQLEATASQAETSELRVGQEATVSLDAYPGLTFHGKVYSVGALARASMFESYYVRTVPVNIQISGQDSRLLPDMSGAADIVLGRAENKVLVPLEALREENGQYFVYLKNGLRFEKRFVQVGLKNDTHAAVVSGLKAGDEVALAAPPVITS